jgi:hypothetical protein
MEGEMGRQRRKGKKEKALKAIEREMHIKRKRARLRVETTNCV